MVVLLAMTMLGCRTTAPVQTPAPEAPVLHALAADWTGPYGGVPPFDAVVPADLDDAVRSAMAAERAAIDTIAGNPEPATFENTIVAMERASGPMNRALTLYFIWSGTFSTPELREMEQVLDPELAAHSDKTLLDPMLWARVKAVYEARTGLTAEQQRLAWLYWNQFRRAGAELDDAGRARVAAINLELSSLYTTFSQNLLADEDSYVLYLTEADLAGLPDSVKAAAAAAAEQRGHAGEWAITNTRSSMDPFLTFSSRRDLREKVWRTYYSRGDNGDTHDNNAIITKILALRAERAKLLGFETFAHFQLDDSMAHTPERAMALMEKVWPLAVSKAKAEVQDMQALASKERPKVVIEPWDYRYYAEKVRKAKYDIDQNALKPYLQLEKLREGMFWAAGQLYGFQFTQVSDVPVASPDIRVWRVDDAQGKLVGLWYFDPYARQGKRSGAWMNAYRTQDRLDGDHITIVSNNCNFVKGAPGEPVLISWDDAETLFHEFGHALHGLSSNVTYPSLAGTAVARDFVEFPSQLNEAWLSTPEVLSRFAVHFQTGEPIPTALVEKIHKAATFNQGFATTEYLASALVDLKLHLEGDKPIDPDAYERDTLQALGLPKEIVMRHRTPQFAHVFSGEGYAARYYSYLWADTLTEDAEMAFRESPGGLYDATTAARLRDTVLSVGNTKTAEEAWLAFRGRDVQVDALLQARGLVK